jgi:hypothetical protein
MKSIRLSILLILSLTLASCTKFLDVKPAGKLIPESGDVSSFDKLLNNTNTISYIFYNNNGISALNFLGDDIQLSDNQADFAWYNGHPNIDCYFAHIFKKPYGNPATQDYYWNWGFYKAAQYFNACIDGVNKVKTADTEKEAQETIAEATVARAWGYFVASLGYGPVYKPKGDNSAKVLPYRTASDVMSQMEDLSTLQQIYDRVLSDIHTSLPNIPDRVSSNTRFGKVQTYAFLAYYHLFTAHYDSVAFYADKALTMAAAQAGGMENLFYDMNQFSWADAKVATDPDSRFSSSINTTQGSDPVDASYMRENCLYRECGNGGYGSDYPSDEYQALFDRKTDLRCEYFLFEYAGYKTKVNGVTYDDGKRIQSYQYKVATTSGFTYPEILLMRAEGRARTNDVAGALSDLNYLRKFRHKTGTPNLNISGADNVMLEVANERRRELPIGSYKRFADLKRYTNDAGKPWSKSEITHMVKGKSYTQKIDSDYYILPIRNDVLRWNPQWGIDLDETPWTNSKD